jgi:hypothetical protein|tara:strand:+ start:3055 stop:3807 length:753 start_codon:yes stop_codon:yes gene_type:complete
MSGFTDHNIKHSSISQINKWIEAPDAWVSHYLFGNRGSASSAMWRGIFSEQAVSDTITETLLIDDAIERAVKDFDDKIMFDDDGSAGKEREHIEPITRLAVEALEPYGKPDFPEDGQHKVNMKATGDGWELDFIGFLDFKFPNHGLIVDLKTTLRMPSIMPKGHQRQRGFYAKASGNAAVKFLYVTPKKFDMKEDGDPDELMAEIKLHLTRQERFLRLGDKDLLRDIVPVSPDSFYWRGDEAVRQRLYGI